METSETNVNSNAPERNASPILVNNEPAKFPEPKKTSKRKIITTIFLLIILAIISFTIFNKFISKKANQKITSTKNNFLPFGKMSYSFAEFKLDNTPFKPSLPEYTVDYSELLNLSSFETSQKILFSNNQKAVLNLNHFFITVNSDKFYLSNPEDTTERSDDWTQLYSTIGGSTYILYRKPENAVFITSDFLLHVYHRLLEKEFEYIEQREFYPKLKEITDALLDQVISNYNGISNEENKKSYERLIAFFSVPKVFLDSAYEEFSSWGVADQKTDTKENILSNLDNFKSKIPPASYNLARMEIDLIQSQAKPEKSPIFGDLYTEEELLFLHDYTQYGPRSHYNKNSVLRTYFKAMMWYGRNNLALKSPQLTRDAINIVILLSQTNQLKNWEDIYAPTAFFVGKSDDLGIYEYGEIMESLGVKEADDKTIDQVQQKLKDYRGPQIMSEAVFGNKVFDLTKEELQQKTKGFHFMGQRFTPDAFIFTNLTQGDEKADPETGEKLPSSTTALMVMLSLGNKTAGPLANEWINKNALQSKNVLANRLATLTQQFNNTPENIWTQNIYWSWLYTIKSLFTESLNKTGYPGFMKNNFWSKKDLQTSLGSWTELKHDTLLYAKQSYAEKGGGGGEEQEIPPVPKGYVEPNIVFLDRLIALSQMTKDGLMNRGLLDNEFQSRNERLIESLKFFRTIAVKEIQNEIISDDDFEKLRLEAGRLGFVLEPLPGEEPKENNARSALIADVHTDAVKGQILYEATGIPNYIFVVIKDNNGIRLTKGLVFSYFEFNNPLGQRLTDEAWREINYTPDKSKLPPLPEWATSLIK